MNCAVNENKEAQGRIIASVGGLYTVETSYGIYACKARGVFRNKGIVPYVGDYVELSEDKQVITTVMPRRNLISRPPVANVDLILCITSTCKPSPNLQILDSFLTIALYLDIQPVVVFTKIDLHSAEQLQEVYQSAGFLVYCADYTNPQSITQIADLLNDKTAMMTGNSGVGKSTLLNAIEPDLKIATGEISEKLGRGKHTTRQVQLYHCAGGYLADTPGFSTLDPEQYVHMKKECIADCFPDFRPYLGKCQFTDCAHICEKGCAVLEALEQGKIAKSRHESYKYLYQIAKERKEWET